MRKPHPMHIKNLQHRTFVQVVVSCSFQGKLFRAFHFPRLWQSKPQSMCRFNRAIDFISDNHNIRPCALSTASSKTITTYAHVPCQQRHRWQSQHTTRGPVDSVIDDNHNIRPGALSTASSMTITTYHQGPFQQLQRFHLWQSQHTPMCPVDSVIDDNHNIRPCALSTASWWQSQHTTRAHFNSSKDFIRDEHNIRPCALSTASSITITTYHQGPS